MSTRQIEIPAEVFVAIKKQAEAEAPNEACGYLVGRIEAAGGDGVDRGAIDPAEELRVVTRHIPMTNADASPEHFTFHPGEQFGALTSARSGGEELVGVYHSHPATPARMSNEDIRLANDVDMVYVIHSLATGDTKAFSVTKEKDVTRVGVREGVRT